ncbi:DUF1048 domain-containing protein [Mumia zhuanghuii]|uniref:DUF1048 domain-containing protein n=2 Tax=Mumia TaxID=1546255 RepID=A0ABW1QIZ3_9ACTN|nr:MULTISPECIES: DUF1048 domain-containing protein [Mumia]KAA1424790.1 DUF1048 domain-containing protein [Mumia zhuanghuii]
MTNILNKIIGDKKQWKRMEARAGELPRDYRVVYDEIKRYMWRFTSGDGSDIVAILDDVLATFEAGAADGLGVLEVTGEDVAAFCDDRLQGAKPYDGYLAKWRTSLNQVALNQVALDQDVKKKA